VGVWVEVGFWKLETEEVVVVEGRGFSLMMGR
jgi:hypothetical protein